MAKRIGLLIALLAMAWCVMTFSHEVGHILGGWATGGVLQSADLWPWHLPYSIFAPNPRPLFTLWCGPLFGVLAPFALALVIRRDWSWFVASFCLLANGVYIAGAWVSGDRYLDTTEMLRHGAHPLSLAIYCLITIIGGYVGFRRAAIRILFANQVLSEAGQDTPFEDCSG